MSEPILLPFHAEGDTIKDANGQKLLTASTALALRPDCTERLAGAAQAINQHADLIEAFGEVEGLLSPLPDELPPRGNLVKALTIIRAELGKLDAEFSRDPTGS